MPAATALEIRREIIKRYQEGKTLQSISVELQISYETVRKICRHWRTYGKLSPNYEQAHQRGSRRYPHLYQEAMDMKRAHPRWGAGLIQVQLAQTHPDVPTPRTLQRWFREGGVARTAKVRQSGSGYVKRGEAVHQTWAIDAKERMQLADGSSASWLVVTDEASGAILEATHFPPVPLDND